MLDHNIHLPVRVTRKSCTFHTTKSCPRVAQGLARYAVDSVQAYAMSACSQPTVLKPVALAAEQRVYAASQVLPVHPKEVV